MGKLIYTMNVSLDGFVETPDHSLDWATVDEELHFWFNEQARQLDASLYGRGMYDVMAGYWPTAESDPNATEAMREYAGIWRSTPKVVFSSSLETVDSNCRLVRGDVGEELRRLRTEFEGDMDVGGATLAASFIRRGLVDEYRMIVHPIAIGAGTPYFPDLKSEVPLRLVETRTFQSGAVALSYSVQRE